MFAFFGAMLALLLAALDQSIVATALPRIAADLHGFSNLSWVVAAYLLASTATVPLYGKLSDLYGRRAMFVIAIVIFLVGSALCGAAQSMTELIVFRAIQGLGAGGLIPLVQALVGDLFSPRERGKYQGYMSSVWGIAAIAGPLVGGVFTDQASWRWIFLVNLPLGAVALVVVVTQINPSVERREHSIDYIGSATLTAAIVSVLMIAVWGGSTYAWGSPEILSLAAAAVALLAVFILIERRAREPVIPLRLFASSIVRSTSLAAFAVGAVLFGTLIYIPVYAQGVLGSSATNAGLLLLPLNFAWMSVNVIVGRLILRTGRYRRYPIIGGVITILGVYLLTRLGASSDRLDVLVAGGFVGLGMGLTVQTNITAVQNSVERPLLGVATATNQLFRSIGGTLGVAAFGTLLASRLESELQKQLGSAATSVDPEQLLRSPGASRHFSPSVVDHVHAALAQSLHVAFVAALPLAALMLVGALLLKELPLRTTSNVADGVGLATDPST